jgi:hypothetical protein
LHEGTVLLHNHNRYFNDKDKNMTAFGDREKTFENKFANLEETRFKTEARRNRLIGIWAAGLLGKTGAAADDYVKEVLKSDLEEPGDHDVLRKVYGDLNAAGVAMTEAQVRAQLDTLYREAKQQIKEGV